MIKTNTPITVMKRGALLPTDTESKVIHGEILSINTVFERGGVEVLYAYYTPIIYNEGEDNEFTEKSHIEQNINFYSFETMEIMKSIIPAIPEGLTEKDETIFKYKEAMKIKMSEKFGVDMVNIVDI